MPLQRTFLNVKGPFYLDTEEDGDNIIIDDKIEIYICYQLNKYMRLYHAIEVLDEAVENKVLKISIETKEYLLLFILPILDKHSKISSIPKYPIAWLRLDCVASWLISKNNIVRQKSIFLSFRASI